jgi:hypothetical protein
MLNYLIAVVFVSLVQQRTGVVLLHDCRVKGAKRWRPYLPRRRQGLGRKMMKNVYNFKPVVDSSTSVEGILF